MLKKTDNGKRQEAAFINQVLFRRLDGCTSPIIHFNYITKHTYVYRGQTSNLNGFCMSHDLMSRCHGTAQAPSNATILSFLELETFGPH